MFFPNVFPASGSPSSFPFVFPVLGNNSCKLCLVAEVEATSFPWRDFVDGQSEGMAGWDHGQGTPSGEENLRDVFETLLQEE